MYGIVTRNPEELTWPEFDRGCFEMKSVTGRLREPVDEGTNMIACFGDTARGVADPDLVPMSQSGERATRDRPYFDWGYICPSRESYRTELLDVIEEAATHTPDIRLDDIGFPRDEYCHCQSCQESFAASDMHDWGAWRSQQITSFLQEVRDRVPGQLSVTVYPDPFPGHLANRTGVDLAAIQSVIDELVVPLYDTNYGTTYWVEALLNGFRSRVSVSLGVELYAVDVDIDALCKVTAVVEDSADVVYFGFDAARARGVIRRVRAETSEGATYGDGSE